MITPNWELTGTIGEINGQTGFVFKVGWNESCTDTALLVKCPGRYTDSQYHLMVWNRPGVRQELLGLLNMEIHTGIDTLESISENQIVAAMEGYSKETVIKACEKVIE